jgi:4-amino-4-deoxy-L-arabinose transferase-like glycosyltransferase
VLHSAPVNRSTWALLLGILLLGALVRLRVHDVKAFSRADETVYLLSAKRLSSEGVAAYPDMVRNYLGNRQNWLYPPPLRFGYLGAIGLACQVGAECTHRSLAWVSTLAGILALVATFLLVRELVDVPVALAATALSVASPLQLALGRRALSDEVYCAAVLFALWALVRAARAPPGAILGRYAVSILLSALAVSIKETAVLLLPAALIAVYVLRGKRFDRRDLVLFVAPALLAYLVFSLLAGSASAAFSLVRAEHAGTVGASYIEQHNSGPAHRLLVDLLMLAPLTSILALASLTLCVFDWRNITPGLRTVVLVLAFILLVGSILPVKNVRYVVHTDAFIRALAAWLLVARVGPASRFGRLLAGVLGLTCVLNEAVLFHRIFVAGEVYDPVTDNLTRALEMAP